MDLPFSSDGIPQEILDSLSTLATDIPVHTRIDKGASGYVFLGNHAVLNQPRAIKYYYGGDEFHDEVRALAEIRSPNILPIYDARTINGGYAYFVTDVFDGGDLDNYINGSNYSVRNAIRIIKDVLSGAAELHGKRFVHRDLKPGNILVSNIGRPVIADFGSVRLIPDGQDFVTGSRHATLYRPPESWHDRYEFRSDIYQLGIVLYQLLGGHLPYAGEEHLSVKELKEYSNIDDDCDKSLFIDEVIRRKAERGSLIKMSSVPPYLPPKIRRIIAKAVNPDPSKRYDSASNFRLALHDLGEPVDWQVNGDEYVARCDGRDFRIRPVDNNQYRCETGRSGSNSWRKHVRVRDGELSQVLSELNELL